VDQVHSAVGLDPGERLQPEIDFRISTDLEI
jgi:hypothetical protein